MKKFGFTLSEVLIALTIVAIVATATASSIENMIPDRSKVKVLKAHKTISEITADILNNKTLYYPSNPNANPGDENYCEGLRCSDIPLDDSWIDMGYEDPDQYNGAEKYGRLLAANMEIVKDSLDSNSGGGWVSFDTVDGMNWMVQQVVVGNDLSYTITVNINPLNGARTFIEDRNKPTTFLFHVDNLGHVTAGDPLTRAYLENPMKLSDRKNDKRRAEGYISSGSSNSTD